MGGGRAIRFRPRWFRSPRESHYPQAHAAGPQTSRTNSKLRGSSWSRISVRSTLRSAIVARQDFRSAVETYGKGTGGSVTQLVALEPASRYRMEPNHS